MSSVKFHAKPLFICSWSILYSWEQELEPLDICMFDLEANLAVLHHKVLEQFWQYFHGWLVDDDAREMLAGETWWGQGWALVWQLGVFPLLRNCRGAWFWRKAGRYAAWFDLIQFSFDLFQLFLLKGDSEAKCGMEVVPYLLHGVRNRFSRIMIVRWRKLCGLSYLSFFFLRV